jgi:hypothetical protein
MSMLDHLATTLLGLVKLGVPVLGVLLVSGKLQRVLDDRGLYKVQPFPLLPIIAGLVLEWVLIRGSGLAPALELKHVWTEPAWSTDLVTLANRELALPVLAEQARLTLAILLGDPGREPVAAALLLGSTAAIAGMSLLAWRSARAWRGVFLHLWFAGAVWLMLHHLVVLIYWTLHWLNFWIFFVLLAFVQMRRSEGPADKHQSA